MQTMPDALDKRRLILDAAQRVFAESGFHTSTMDAVAEAAGVAKGTIYLYFKSKNELLYELVEDRVAMLLSMVDMGISNAHDSAEKFRATIAAHFEFYSRESGLMSLLAGQFGLLAPELAGRIIEATRALTDRFVALIVEAMEAGAIRQGFDPLRLAFALQGSIHAVAFAWISLQTKAPAGIVCEEVYQLFMSGAMVNLTI